MVAGEKKSVVVGLQGALHLEPKAGDTQQSFAERLARKANDMKDDAWEALDQDAQVWVNKALEAIERKKAVPLPKGIDTIQFPAKGAKPGATKKEPKKKSEVKGKASIVASPGADGRPVRGRVGRYLPSAKISIMAKENPHRATAKDHKKFGLLRAGMTVAEASEAGLERAYLRYIADEGHIAIK